MIRPFRARVRYQLRILAEMAAIVAIATGLGLLAQAIITAAVEAHRTEIIPQ